MVTVVVRLDEQLCAWSCMRSLGKYVHQFLYIQSENSYCTIELLSIVNPVSMISITIARCVE